MNNIGIEHFNTLEAARDEALGEGSPPLLLSVDELTTQDNRLFTETYAVQQGWSARLTQKHAEAKARLLELENKRTYVEVAVVVLLKEQLAADRSSTAGNGKLVPGGVTNEEVKQALWTDSYYTDLIVAHQMVAQQKVLLEGHMEIIRSNLTVLSRMVTIRGQELELVRLEGGLTRRGRK